MTRPAATNVRRPGASGEGSPTLLGGAIVTTALLAGTYYAFAVAVMPGLREVDDEAFVTTMQEVNDAIVNPAFMVAFLGAPVLTGIAAWQWRGVERRAAGRRGRLVLAALALHLAGFGLTVAGQVPRNDALAAVGAPSALSRDQLAEARAAYEQPWTRRHLLRTAITVGALGCLTAAAIVSEGRDRT